MRKYKVYTDASLITHGHIELLTPFFGDPDVAINKDPRDPQHGRFQRFENLGNEFLELVDKPSDADIFVYPIKWKKNSSKLSSFLEYAARYDKQTLVFFNDDSSEDMNLANKNVIVFRTSFFKSTRKHNEYSFPGWSPDPGPTFLKEKEVDPIVGFCGCCNNNAYRLASIHTLNNDTRIKTNFQLYDRFWGGWGTGFASTNDYDYANKVRRGFIQNVCSSDYTLCSTGSGNFSYRLYETLSCGRIPIIINTDIVLPHEELLDWKEISIWVDPHELGSINEIILQYHNSLSSEDFLEKQKLCRKVYENYIRPTSFFKMWFGNR